MFYLSGSIGVMGSWLSWSLKVFSVGVVERRAGRSGLVYGVFRGIEVIFMVVFVEVLVIYGSSVV